MSKLDELIAELCPNGVEYKSLGEIATIARGGNFQKRISVIGGSMYSLWTNIYKVWSVYG